MLILLLAPVVLPWAGLGPDAGLTPAPGGASTAPGGANGGNQSGHPPAVLPPDSGGDTEVGTDSRVVAVVDHVGPAVVGVVNQRYVRDRAGNRFLQLVGTGSGLVFDPDGYIVTNYHVIENADVLEVVFEDGRVVEAEVVAHDDPFSDVAVLKIPDGDWAYASFGDSSGVRVGETVVAIGNPQGLDFFRSVTRGVVSGIRADLLQQLAGGSSNERIFELIQTDAAINRGNSGGPLVNLQGEVIGINTLKFGGNVEGMGFAIPSNDVKSIARDLIEHGYVVRPALGLTLLSDDWAESRYGVNDGVVINDVTPGGPADRAGMRSGDIILSVNGVDTPRFVTLIKEVNRYEVGTTIKVKIRRGESEHELDIVLGELARPG